MKIIHELLLLLFKWHCVHLCVFVCIFVCESQMLSYYLHKI